MSSDKSVILALCGSIRAQSTNQSLIDAVAKIAGDRFVIKPFPVASLPHFNPDVDDAHIEPVVYEFRQQIDAADGVLISTPEYVFSIPGVVKNAIEWTVSTTVFSDKPVALITASTSGKEAHQSLTLVMRTIYARLPDECRLLIQAPKNKLDKEGNITDPATHQQLETLIDAFGRTVSEYQAVRHRPI